MKPFRPDWRHRLLARYYRAGEHPGRLRLLKWLKAALLVDLVRVEVVPGVVMELDDRDYVQREILVRGGYELATLARFDSLLGDASGCTDFGAHMGLYTLRAARALAPGGGRVFAIEPTPLHAMGLLHNAALSGLTNIDLCSVAFSDQPALLRMIAPHPANTGGSRLATDGNYDEDLLPIPLHVAVRPAGELATVIPPACLDVMKLDVEGFEFRILRSLFAATTMRPRHILFEYLPRVFDVGDDNLAWLRSEGYDLLTVDGRPYEPGTRPPDDNLWARRIN